MYDLLVAVTLQQNAAQESTKGEIIYSDDDMASEGDSETEEKKPLSKKKARKMNRLTVAELKQLVKKPEVV